jgi:hypothetical protein
MKAPLPVMLGVSLLVLSVGAAEARVLKGQVLLVGEHDETMPAVGVDVMLREVGNPVRTKAGGLFRIEVPDILRPGDRVTLIVEKKDWRVWYPLAGEARLPADPEREVVVVRLLPVGSKRFLSDASIEKLIADAQQTVKEQVRPGGLAGTEGRRDLQAAVTAYRAALEVYTRAELPQQWAATQNNLGATLQEQGIRIAGEAGARLLAEAVQAFEGALEVYREAGAGYYVQGVQRNLEAARGALAGPKPVGGT